MRSAVIFTSLLSVLPSLAQDSGPGYDCSPHCIASTIPENKQFSFGRPYAVLNLDLISAIVSSVENTPAGKAWISNTAKWIDSVHAQNPAPLSIFTRIYFSNSHKPEIGPKSPFAQVGGALGTANDELTKLYPAFDVDREAGDVVLPKTRYYAGAGNALEEILKAQQIDTVILSGIRTAGVVLSTAYRLFDLDYKV